MRALLSELALNMETKDATSSSPSPSISSVNHHLWKSPLPYLFGSLVLMLILIASSLLLLLISYWRRSSLVAGDRSSDEKISPEFQSRQNETRQIVVIMAGADKPTYVATPVVAIAMPSANVCSCCHSNDGGDNGGSDQHLVIKV